MIQRIAIGFVAIALLLGLLVYSQMRVEPLKVSGYVEADEIRLGSRVGGRVKAVHCQEGQAVTAGTLLLELEEFDLLARKAEATAQVAASEAELARLKNGFREEEIAQAQARVELLAAKHKMLVDGPRAREINAARARRDLAVAQVERAKLTYARLQDLFAQETGSVSRDEVDRSIEEVKVTEQTQRVREEELKLLEEGTRAEEITAAAAELKEAEQALKLFNAGNRSEDIAQAEAAVAAVQAALAAIEVQLNELQIRASVDGVVEAIELQPGDMVGMGTPVLSLMDTRTLWVRAYVPESRLNIAIDQEVRITTDSFTSESFRGKVTFISRQAEFTPRNAQTPEERSKQVFRIKVTLLDGLDKLRPGMAADVWLE
ncbi:MAG: HlyD family efflux transporter periplasmic adaptor subunit [Planctomycetaceae bacterium]|nr:HlyD family efflux transporter periplasmic adaptor subunit [Planctomycetales bacterium]MCB9939796.1 HlyD family efflux transporter periplasmic adaptor subunit [Planctomycetaceae bacterium]